jgi:hypothetical protein
MEQCYPPQTNQLRAKAKNNTPVGVILCERTFTLLPVRLNSIKIVFAELLFNTIRPIGTAAAAVCS